MINIFYSNFAFLIQLLEYEWTWVVSCRLSTKAKVWKPVYFDPRQFRCIENRFCEAKFQALLVHSNGAYYTHDHLSRFKSDNNDMCPWCEQHDSIVHRVTCKGLCDIRKRHSGCQDLHKCDELFLHHAIQITPDEVWGCFAPFIPQSTCCSCKPNLWEILPNLTCILMGLVRTLRCSWSNWLRVQSR